MQIVLVLGLVVLDCAQPRPPAYPASTPILIHLPPMCVFALRTTADLANNAPCNFAPFHCAPCLFPLIVASAQPLLALQGIPCSCVGLPPHCSDHLIVVVSAWVKGAYGWERKADSQPHRSLLQPPSHVAIFAAAAKPPPALRESYPPPAPRMQLSPLLVCTSPSQHAFQFARLHHQCGGGQPS